MSKRKGPTPGQLDAAIEGARDMPEAPKGAGRVIGPGESQIDRGLLNSDGDPYGVEPDEAIKEAIKRDTAVFIPGTGKKPEGR
jgi:hypothetical protein